MPKLFVLENPRGWWDDSPGHQAAAMKGWPVRRAIYGPSGERPYVPKYPVSGVSASRVQVGGKSKLIPRSVVAGVSTSKPLSTKRSPNPVQYATLNPVRSRRGYFKKHRSNVGSALANPIGAVASPNPAVDKFFSVENMQMLGVTGAGIMGAQWFANQVVSSQTTPSRWMDPVVRFAAAGVLAFLSEGVGKRWSSWLTYAANGAGIAALFSLAKQFPIIQSNLPGLSGVGGGNSFGPAPVYRAFPPMGASNESSRILQADVVPSF